jgi:hypothetical protein
MMVMIIDELHYSTYVWFHKNHSSNLIPICKSCHNNITKNKIVHRKTKTSKGMALIEE